MAQREWVLMNGKRFWDGTSWVSEYPDATRYSVTNGNQLMATAKRIQATAIVADYGTNVEKRITVPWTAVILDEEKPTKDYTIRLTMEITREELNMLRVLVNVAQDEHIKENGAQLHPVLVSLARKLS